MLPPSAVVTGPRWRDCNSRQLKLAIPTLLRRFAGGIGSGWIRGVSSKEAARRDPGPSPVVDCGGGSDGCPPAPGPSLRSECGGPG